MRVPGRGGESLSGAPARPERAGAPGQGSPPAPSPRRRALALCLVLAAALVLSGALVRVVRVEGPSAAVMVWLWAWQEGRVEFINSITVRPVVISFSLPWRFSGFAARTDPGTEEYYTAGVYSWNQRLAGEKTHRISYCSEVGVTLVLGRRIFKQQGGGCLNAFWVWPP